MKIKKVIKQDGEYQCDIDVTVDEWKKILQDKTIMNKNYVDVLLKFYSEPEHKSTCKELGIKYDKSPQSFNGTITNFAKATQKKLNRFEVIGTDGESSFWIIAMTGKYKGEHFEWTMRPELVKAIEEIDIRNTIQYDMDYFNLTEENLVQLSNDIGKKYDGNNKGASIYFDTRKKLQYFGRLLSEELELSLVNNYNEKPNKQAGRGKGFVLKEYILAGFIPKKHHKETSNNLFIKLSFWGFDSNKPHFGVDIDVNFSDGNNQFNKLRDLFQQQYWSIPIKDFPNNWTDLIDLVKPQFQRMADYIDSYFSKIETSKEMIPYIELLKANKNLILTGAPGTGKTYLAKQIAKSMNAETEFVQFHPSYDYTDFVEGLRPTPPDENGNIGFELKDGVFKTFCKKALKSTISNGVDNFEEAWDKLLLSVKENLSTGNLTKIGSWEYGLSSKDSLKYSSENTPSQYNFTITKQNVYDAYQDKKARPSGAFQKDMVDVVDYMKAHLGLKDYKQGAITQSSENKFVLIIDEINRAEISKVLGELFFSIDPGYRGTEGKVKTQYANLQESDDVFADGFYVPENIYIIGTMNDIDRSVESMDFAMRRRFAWQEIKAEDRVSMWDGNIDTYKEDAKIRMTNLNTEIDKIPELGSAYCIGPAYFLKLKEYDGDFQKLWINHIQGVLFEYLRGLPNSKDLLKKLEDKYNLINGTEND